ncbi:Putative O-acetyltransferase sat14 [Epichloe bromicola]|uniref:O-acetyltransferase sat14 n=1 Tax=Epichloe bromicola TaxID=79588 RepID=A0ABQ0CEW2_9HYPO
MVQLSSLSADETVLKLPHPYLTEYVVQKSDAPSGNQAIAANVPFYQLRERRGSSKQQLPSALHNDRLVFSEPADLKSSELPPDSDNSAWARARRSPCSTVAWGSGESPSLAQAWLLLYTLFTVRPGMESLRLELAGANAATVASQLRDVVLAIDHPLAPRQKRSEAARPDDHVVVVALRSTFWQGAGSPFGPRPVWCPAGSPASLSGAASPLASYPLTPVEHKITILSAGDPRDPERTQQAFHPIRPAKPAPGATVYSRWIPHLNETFSMVSLDYQDDEHLGLFHEWQNDPRVSQGWNETGTLDQHREYLRNIHDDPHQVAILAKWDDTFFAYFEVYWAKEDRLGGYYNAGDFDRGRHSLVGDVRFRGPHRVTAWWSSLVHYLFLDDPRTMHVVGEPKSTNSTVIMYDLIHGFGVEHFVDLPHKRSACVRCPRGRFFQLCPLAESDKVVGGLRIGLVPKL